MSIFNSALIACFCLLLPLPAAASFVRLPLSTALADSDLVVVATLQKPTVVPRPTGRVIIDFHGVLKVHQHLAGDALPKGSCTLDWTVVQGMSGHVDHRPAVGKKAIWLLRRLKKGHYSASHPAASRPLKELAAVKAALKRPLYRVDTRGKNAAKACCVDLEIRTFLPRLEVRDFVSTKGKRIRLHGKAWIEVQGQMGKELAPRRGCLVRAPKRGFLVVTRERPHRVQLDLRRCFSLARRGMREVFHFRWGRSKKEHSASLAFELR